MSGPFFIRSKQNGLTLEPDGNRVLQNNWTGSQQQQWKLEQTGDRFFIRNVATNQVMERREQLTHTPHTGQDIQKWGFNRDHDRQDGTVIITADNLKVMDVPGASMNHGNYIHFWDRHNGKNQRWVLEPVKEVRTIGTFYIRNNNGLVLEIPNGNRDVETKVVMQRHNGGQNQQWVQEQRDDFFNFRNVQTGRYLDVAENGQIQQFHYYGGTTQRFKISTNQEGGCLNIITQCGDQGAFDNSNNAEGGTIKSWGDRHGGKQQRWVLEPTNKQVQNLGTVYLKAKVSGQVLEIANGNKDNECRVTQNKCTEAPYQRWVMEKHEDDTIIFRNVATDKVLDIHDNNNVQQYNFWGGLHQRWKVRGNPDGTAHIISCSNVKSNKCIDIPGGSQNQGIAVQIWDVQNDNINQKFIVDANPNATGTPTPTPNPNPNTGGNGTGTGQIVIGGGFKVSEKISFTGSVTTNAGQLTEVNHYRHQFNLERAQAVHVTLHIPFVGNDTGGKRSRIQLRVDNEPVCDSTKFNTNSWELHEVTLTALVNLGIGPHTLSLWACVDGGTLQIPHYNGGCIEHTVQSPIFANLLMFGLGF